MPRPPRTTHLDIGPISPRGRRRLWGALAHERPPPKLCWLRMRLLARARVLRGLGPCMHACTERARGLGEAPLHAEAAQSVAGFAREGTTPASPAGFIVPLQRRGIM